MANGVQKKCTIEELESLPDDGNKYELIYGELFVSTRRRDRVVKRALYADLAIPEYWMVDRQNRSVRIIRGDTDIIAGESFEWHPVGTKNPLVISLADLFGAVT